MPVIRRKINNKHKEENSLQYKASLTVESAFILPFFFFTAVVIAGMLNLYSITVRIQSVLCESAKELGMYAYCTAEDDASPVGTVNNGICIAYGTKKVRETLKSENLQGIAGGVDGIVLLNSGYKDEIISLNAVFFYQIPVSWLKGFPVKIDVTGQARAWTGYQGKLYDPERNEEMVYITEWESVYHKTDACSYLNLSVSKISGSSINGMVNVYGEHYHKCDKCVADEEIEDQVFITQTGNCYHNSEQCSGITRHIKSIKKSEAENLKVCRRCGGK